MMDNLAQMQKSTITILKKIDKICNTLGLKYWIMFGTLIGAVRDKGFIPWDDDLDIAMSRSDYDILHNYFINKRTVDGLHLDCIDTNSRYPFYIDRICDDCWELEFNDFKYKSGAFVDIYPLDGMGKKEDIEYWNSKQSFIYKCQKGMTLSEYNHALFGKTIINKIGNIPFYIIAKLKGNRFYFQKLDEIAHQYNWEDSDYVGITVWENGVYLYPKSCFEGTVYLDFEDFSAPAPIGYDEILRLYYGDYMILPPIEQRVSSHGYTAKKIR